MKHHEAISALHAAFVVATAPTACGIETCWEGLTDKAAFSVATAPTACGIETTPKDDAMHVVRATELQQHLPLAVLKLNSKHFAWVS